jgi:cytoskeletal protein RodZ
MLQEIGEMLRCSRQEKGLSLSEIQAATRVNIKYLKALERGDFTPFPAGIYFTGMLKIYANCLGLNGQEVVGQYKLWHQKQQEIKNSIQVNNRWWGKIKSKMTASINLMAFTFINTRQRKLFP